MRLADHMLAACGTVADVGDFCTFMRRRIQQAQRFEVADEVARAAGDLILSRPSTLVAALPLCRLPYETLWIEYRGGLLGTGAREFDGSPVPWKQGVLIESMPGSQAGFMTIAWMHQADRDREWLHPVNISPIAIYFDWSEHADVGPWLREAHKLLVNTLDGNARSILDAYRNHLERKWLGPSSEDETRVNAVFTGRTGWEGLAGNKQEIEAMKVLGRHMVPGLSPHGIGIICTLLSRARTDQMMTNLMLKWEADMQGEGGWVQCFLAMLNSRNPVVEHTPVDMSKLNKARRKSGKPEFLPYSTTRLAMSRSQTNIARARGIDRESAKQHLVRGHFKIRRTGVYWWSPFVRGDARKGTVKREEYEVR